MIRNIGIRPAFEEDVEEHQIQRHEDADHQAFQEQEGDHVIGHALLYGPRMPRIQIGIRKAVSMTNQNGNTVHAQLR